MLSRFLERCVRHRFVGVLASPTMTFRQVALDGRGFGALLLMLAGELALIYPLSFASAVMRLYEQPVAALIGLWSQYVSYALGPAGVVFAAGYLLSRRRAYAIERALLSQATESEP